jgi:hypothetical protein
MHFTKLACAIALSSAVVYASPSPVAANNAGQHSGNTGNTGNNGASAATGNGATGTTLSANAIQSGSFNDGSNEIGANEVGQALSATSQNNFINNCAGKTLTNGLQITTGSCNGISKCILKPIRSRQLLMPCSHGGHPSEDIDGFLYYP